MYNVQEILPQIFWAGGNTRYLEKFENLIPIPDGISYNSYLILDEKSLLFDTVDISISDQFLENVEFILNDRTLDYLVISHMELDHSSLIVEMVSRYPNLKLIGNTRTFQYFSQFFDYDLSSNFLTVSEGTQLSLGLHNLQFIMAPMLHWPEVMFTYDITSGLLFSADAFGSFGMVAGNLFADEVEAPEGEVRRYYSNIIGRYGGAVQSALHKLNSLAINYILPLHGLIWRGDSVSYILERYDLWSRYIPEAAGLVIAYASMYGNTQNAVSILANKLSIMGVNDIRMYDITKVQPSYIISDFYRFSNIVLAAPTYNMNLFPTMDALIRLMIIVGVKDRKVSIIGNHTWASAAVSRMTEMITGMEGMEIIGTPIDILSSVKPDDEPAIDELANEIYTSLTAAL